MTIDRTDIEGLYVVRWETHEDGRGFFRQTYQQREIGAALGREVDWRQGNHARSAPGVVRGFHAEPWDKLVYVVRGTATVAVADVRPHSATFGHAVTFELGDPPGERVRLLIGEGLAHAYGTHPSGPVDYLYEVSAEWHDADKRAVAWDDPDLAVVWPVDDPILSDADRANPTLRTRFPDHPRWTKDDGEPR